MIAFPPVIDSTMLSAFDACETKWLQEFVIRRVPEARNIHLHAGGCMAKAFENIRKLYYKDHFELDICFEIAFQEFHTSWGAWQPHKGVYKDLANCWMAVEAYFREYPPATDHLQPLMKDDGDPAVEFRFAIPLPIMHPTTGDPIMFGGRFDMLAKDAFDNIWVVDEKTGSSLGASWSHQWPMRGQFYGYTYAARHHGYPCEGAVIRGIAIQQTQFGFAEHPLQLSDWQLDDWYKQMLRKVERMVYLYERIQLSNADNLDILHNTANKSYGDACSAYGGCTFVDLCTMSNPWEIYNSWQERIWNPLNEDPSSESVDTHAAMGSITLAEAMKE